MIKNAQVVQVLEAGLQAASLRQSAISNNLANVETPGYRRRAVEFEDLLADALESGRPVEIGEVGPEVFRPLNTPVSSNGNDVSMEMEIGELVRNTARYKTYMRLLSRIYRQIELAAQ